MNRTYQGKVSQAELLNAKGHPFEPPQDWDGLFLTRTDFNCPALLMVAKCRQAIR